MARHRQAERKRKESMAVGPCRERAVTGWALPVGTKGIDFSNYTPITMRLISARTGECCGEREWGLYDHDAHVLHKRACRYEKGAWNACNVTANTRTRVDKLKPRSDPTCEPNRTVTKKCKSGLGCRYNRSVKWSECDPATQTRTKTMPLVSGNTASCESHKVVTKPCRTNGDQRQAKRKPKQDEEDEEDEE
ncbi:hypothetical protein MRX96_046933 [Rhipicephalus microplus]